MRFFNRKETFPPFFRYFYGLMVLFLLASILQAETITIKVNDNRRNFQGWGTSVCWWGNIIGKYPEKTRDSILGLIFDTTSGLGLNIIRYNIGGGDAPSHNHMGVGKEMEGFLSGESADYDWTKDAGQRFVVQAAKARIPPEWFITEAFSNAPPYWMTVSGCASGGENSSNNLKNDKYTAFADYLTEVVKHFKDEWGISFQTLEPLNEPMGDWWNVNGGQEGCSFSRANQSKLIKALYAKITEKKLTTKLSAPDEAGYDETVATYNSYDSITRSYIHQINSHGYSGSKRSELRTIANRDSKLLWASEIDGSGAPAPFDKWKHDHNDIAPALDIAGRVIRDIHELKPDGWIFWQVVESEQAQINLDKNWGCIHADYTGGQKFVVCKKFYALRQFTRFIRPGSQIIDCSGADAVAFLSPQSASLIIVVRNSQSTAVSHSFNLDGVAPGKAPVKAYRTSTSENFVTLDDLNLDGSTLAVKVAAQSITTYCIPVGTSTVTKYPHEDGIPGAVSTDKLRIIQTEPNCVVIQNSLLSNSTISLYSISGALLRTVSIAPGIHRIPLDRKTTGIVVLAVINGGHHYFSSTVVMHR